MELRQVSADRRGRAQEKGEPNATVLLSLLISYCSLDQGLTCKEGKMDPCKLLAP